MRDLNSCKLLRALDSVAGAAGNAEAGFTCFESVFQNSGQGHDPNLWVVHWEDSEVARSGCLACRDNCTYSAKCLAEARWLGLST